MHFRLRHAPLLRLILLCLTFVPGGGIARAEGSSVELREALKAWALSPVEGCVPRRTRNLLVHVAPEAANEEQARAFCRAVSARLPIEASVDCSRTSDEGFAFRLGLSNACYHDVIVEVSAPESAGGAPRLALWRHAPEASLASRGLPGTRAELLSDPRTASRVGGLARLALAGAPIDDASLIQALLLQGAAAELDSIELTVDGRFVLEHGPEPRAPLGLNEAWAVAVREKPSLLQWLTVVMEITGGLGAGAAWYFSDPGISAADWDLPLSKWPEKLVFAPSTLAFDTNAFWLNAIGHPVSGMFYYLAARTNRFSPLQATAVAFVASYAWEMSIEAREKLSINDMYFTPFAGAVVGEAVYQWTSYAYCHLRRRLTLSACVEMARSADARIESGIEMGGRGGADGSAVFAGVRTTGVFDRSGYPEEGGSAIRAGEWASLMVTLGFAPPYEGARTTSAVAAEAEFRSLLAGIQGLAWTGVSTGIWWIDLDQGYFLRDAPLGGERDRYGVVEILGSTAKLRIIRGDVQAEFQVRFTADLAVIDAWALERALTEEQLMQADSSLRRAGFTHSAGGSGSLVFRLTGPKRKWDFTTLLQQREMWKMDGFDRFPEQATSPVETRDSRTRARVEATVRIPGTRARAGIVLQGDGGRNRVAQAEERVFEGRVLGTLRYDF